MSEEYYNGFAEYYDFHQQAIRRDDIRFYTELARTTKGPILEIGCGTGRTLIPSARAGADITGLDLSEDMLSFCRKELQKELPRKHEHIQLIKADMTNFSLNKKFNLITTPFRPFQHLATVQEQLDCLSSVKRHLNPNGLFILDIFDPDIDLLTDTQRAVEFGEEPPFIMPDKRSVKVTYRNYSVDTVNQITHCEMIFTVTHPNGITERLVQSFIMRYIFRWEAEHLLHRAGFKVLDIQGGYNSEPVGAGELVIFAKHSHS